jgi:hypothetical protein
LAFTASALNSNVGASLAVFGYVLAAYYVMGRIVLSGTNWLERRVTFWRAGSARGAR